MTLLIDPTHPEWSDESAVRRALSDAFSVCGDCRRCIDRCSSFPTLFEMLDASPDADPGDMTPAQQDLVVDGCVQCNLCTSTCPYGPGKHELALDVAGLMSRATAMRRANRHTTKATRRAARTMGRTTVVGRLAVRAPSATNRLAGAAPGSVVRSLLARLVGVTSQRRIAPFAHERFSTWFENRPRITIRRSQRSVTIVPTCIVEYQQTTIGKDLVKVYERNGVECAVSDVRCCGAPLLHAGDVDGFTSIAKKNVKALAAEIRSGTDVIVPQPGCLSMIRSEYASFVGDELRAEAEFVAAHSNDPAEYLMAVHRSDDAVLDTDFQGAVPRKITFHSACHLRALGIGFVGRDLMRLTGARVEVVQQCSGIDGIWGLRSGNDDVSIPMGEKFAARIDRSNADLVAGDCSLSNDVVAENTRFDPLHPIQVMARAYGIPLER